MTYSSYSNLYSLGETSFIAGSTYHIDFKIKDSSGNFVDLVGKTFSWKMSPFGVKNTTTLSKTFSSLLTDSYTARVTLSPTDTETLSGKYIHQISFDSDDITNADWESLHSQLLSAGSVTIVTTGITQPSFPRFLTVESDLSTPSSVDVVIDGTDEDDAVVQENITLSGTIRISGSQMFKTITQITYPAGSNSETVTVGGGAYISSTTYTPGQGVILILPKIGA